MNDQPALRERFGAQIDIHETLAACWIEFASFS
jgi:hypothetical protein